MYSSKIYRTALLALVLISFIAGACRKPVQQPNEDAATYKKRLALIYLSKASVGAKAAANAVQAVYKGQKFTPTRAKALWTLNNKVVTGLETVRDRIDKGLGSGAIDAIDGVLADIQKIQDGGVIPLPEDGRAQFFIITNGIRTTLVSLKAVMQAQREPDSVSAALKAKAAVERAQAKATNPQWVFDLVNIVIAAYGEAEEAASAFTVEEALLIVTAKLAEARNLNNQYIDDLPI